MEEINKMIKGMPCVVTGSRAYGPYDMQSDIDIVITFDDAKKMQKWLKKHRIRTFRTEAQNEYGETGGFYFRLGSGTQGIVINVIICNDTNELQAWHQATLELCNIGPIEDREERIDKFRGYLYE